MSPNMKIGLLALVGSAAAVPHYNAHSRFHSSGGFVGPTGGWKQNSTQAVPTGTAVVPVKDQSTTTVDETTYSTQTLYSTITMTRPKSSSEPVAAAAADLSTGSSACGPATVYVTATEKVTVTVPAGGAASSSSSSSSVKYVTVSPSPVASVSSSSASAVKVETSSAAAIPSSESVYVPATSAAAVETSSTSISVIKEEVSSVPVSSAAPSSVAASTSVAASSVVASSTSSSASATSTAGYTGKKRGLAYRWDGASDCKSFSDKMDAGFAWNWESDSRGDIGGIPFIPTLRTLANTGDWSTNVDTAVKAGSSVVFGFNEPDESSQANLGVSAACDAWKTYMNPIASKYPDVSIVSPAVTSSTDAGKGLDWLSSFKSQCPEAVFHAAGIHWYGYGTAGFDEFKAHVESAISKFGKVWVTEFNLVNRSAADSKDFLEKALAYLDSNANCEGYSFYAVGSFDSSFNMLGTGNALTDVGKVYVA